MSLLIKINENNNIDLIYLEPKKIEIENIDNIGGSLILEGIFNSNGKKYTILKCKNSINKIKF